MRNSYERSRMESGSVPIGWVLQEVIARETVASFRYGYRTLLRIGVDLYQLTDLEQFSSAMEALAQGCETSEVKSKELPAVVFAINEALKREIIPPTFVIKWYDSIREALKTAKGSRRWHHILCACREIGVKLEQPTLFE
jgi:hypothetical protein